MSPNVETNPLTDHPLEVTEVAVCVRLTNEELEAGKRCANCGCGIVEADKKAGLRVKPGGLR